MGASNCLICSRVLLVVSAVFYNAPFERVRIGLVRVGINVVPFSSTSFSGYNPYTRDLIAELIALDPQHFYFILTSVENQHYFARSALNCQTICVYDVLPDHAFSSSDSLGEQVDSDGAQSLHCDLYDCINSLDLDVLLCPWIDAKWDRISVLPTVVMMADILQEYHPEVLTEDENKWRHQMFRLACKSATKVMCISEFTRKTVIERFGAEAEKVHAVACAAVETFKVDEAQRSWIKVQEQFGLQKGYLFLPATTWAHKNHLRLFSALGELKKRGLTPPLVLTGGHKMPKEELMSAAAEAGCAEQITHLGFIDQSFMPGLYHGAACLVFPSVFEGLGLPALEALALGCPLLCSDIEVFREVVGDAAIMFDPLNQVEIANAIEQVITSPALAEDLRSRGLARAAECDWQSVARASLSILEQTAALQEKKPVAPFVQGIYPDNWAGPRSFVKRIDRSRWREMYIEGDVPAGCDNVTVAIFRDGVCISALHSQEPTRFSQYIDWPESADDQQYVEIGFAVDRDIVPSKLGLSSDLRRLSFIVLSLVLFDAQGATEVLRGTFDPAYALPADSGFTSKLSGRNVQ